MFHVEHRILALLFAYLCLTFFWSESAILWFDGIVGFLRVVAILSIFVYALKDGNCSTWNNFKGFVIVISFAALLQSSIGIVQFIQNQSLGLNALGESQIGELVPGVAKIDFDNYQQVRAYGTFLHPNILGGFLTLSILIMSTCLVLFRHKLFHVEQLLLYLSIILAFLALILTFSKTALVSLVLIIGMYMFHVEHNKQRKMFHVEQWIFITILGATLLVFYTLGSDQLIKSISERLYLLEINIPHEEEIVIGQGLGQSVYVLDQAGIALYEWQLQPAHSTYATILIDLGIIGTFIVFAVLYKYLNTVPRGTLFISSLPLMALGIIGMADHYVWDIYAGNILLSMAIGWWLTLPKQLTK